MLILICLGMYPLDLLLMSTQVYTEVYLLVYLFAPTSYTHLDLVSLKVFHQPQNQAQPCSFLLLLGSKRLRQLVFRLQSERGHQIPSKHPGVKAQEDSNPIWQIYHFR